MAATRRIAEAAPKLWTQETVGRCVAEVCRRTAGQWTNQTQVLAQGAAHTESRERASLCVAGSLFGTARNGNG